MTQEDYTQPFFIRGSKGHFCQTYEARGFLPPLVPNSCEIDEAPTPIENALILSTELERRIKRLSQLEGELRHIHKDLHEHIAISKRKGILR